MSEEGAEAAPAQNAGFFTGNIMNFERPKFNRRLENRLVAIRAFEKKKVVTSSKEALLTSQTKGNAYWYKTGSDLKAKDLR